jgi:hypothetical protein
MVICSAHGEQTLPDDGAAPPAPPKPCQICITVAAAALAFALAAWALLISLPTALRIAFSPAPSFACAIRRGALGSRAPPLPA